MARGVRFTCKEVRPIACSPWHCGTMSRGCTPSASGSKKKIPFRIPFFCWRRRRDSNPRGLTPKRFSRPPRYDRFDTPPRRKDYITTEKYMQVILDIGRKKSPTAYTQTVRRGTPLFRLRGKARSSLQDRLVMTASIHLRDEKIISQLKNICKLYWISEEKSPRQLTPKRLDAARRYSVFAAKRAHPYKTASL